MLRILQGDAIERLRELSADSVHCCVTSPPYWGLRDYSTNGQLGLEKTPEEYVAKMVEIFREVRRVLRRDGTLWLNLGDSYCGGWKGGNDRDKYPGKDDGSYNRRHSPSKQSYEIELPAKNLVGMPWKLAFALQADGWYLRSDIIWSKPNPMPESVTDRPTKAHEYLFLLTKSPRYFYDAEAIKEKSEPQSIERLKYPVNVMGGPNGEYGARIGQGGQRTMVEPSMNRNKRSVWTVATAPYPEAHFATYPPDLIKPCILAGTSSKGCCAKCGAPWERIVEAETVRAHGGVRDMKKTPLNVIRAGWREGGAQSKTLGWQPTCECFGYFEQIECAIERAKGSVPDGWNQRPGGHSDIVDFSRRERGEEKIELSEKITRTIKTYVPTSEAQTVPCTILDPFAGSGTTGAVALELGRHAILIELNPAYIKLIEERCNVTLGLQLA
jgi:DNA modification methylase